MANPVLSPQYLASKFFEIDSRLSGLDDSSSAVASNANANTSSIQSILHSLIRAAIVTTAVTASSGYPNIGSGKITLLSLDNPTVSEAAILTCFNFSTGGFAVNSIVFVVSLAGTYYIIT